MTPITWEKYLGMADFLAPWQRRNIAAFALNAALTFGVGTGGKLGDAIGAKSNVEISEKYPSLVTPAGWAFAIWGPIFTLEACFTVWQALALAGAEPAFVAASPYWCAGCALQAVWTLAFAFERLALSSLLCAGITAGVGAAYARFRPLAAAAGAPRAARALAGFALALHCAWLIAATLVNVNLIAVQRRAAPAAQARLARWTLALVPCAGAGLALACRESTFALVGVWACLAIAHAPHPRSVAEKFGPRVLRDVSEQASNAALALAFAAAAVTVRELLG